MILDDNLSLTEAVSAILFASTAPVEAAKLASHFEITLEKAQEAVKEVLLFLYQQNE